MITIENKRMTGHELADMYQKSIAVPDNDFYYDAESMAHMIANKQFDSHKIIFTKPETGDNDKWSMTVNSWIVFGIWMIYSEQAYAEREAQYSHKQAQDVLNAEYDVYFVHATLDEVETAGHDGDTAASSLIHQAWMSERGV